MIFGVQVHLKADIDMVTDTRLCRVLVFLDRQLCQFDPRSRSSYIDVKYQVLHISFNVHRRDTASSISASVLMSHGTEGEYQNDSDRPARNK